MHWSQSDGDLALDRQRDSRQGPGKTSRPDMRRAWRWTHTSATAASLRLRDCSTGASETMDILSNPSGILPGSPVYLYGPCKRNWLQTAPSNQAFDRSLRDRNSHWACETSIWSPQRHKP